MDNQQSAISNRPSTIANHLARRICRSRPWDCRCVGIALAAAASFLACDTVTYDSEDGEPVDVALEWLQQHAVPIDNADPDATDPALAVLQQTIGDAQLVGLGEATHGTTEFWGMRQKISRYLVEQMGFTAILFEAPLPNSLHIDAYVTEGIGSAEEAHRRLGYWRYQEMRDLIDWVRAYNTQRAAGEPALHFLGYDCAFRSWTEAIALIADYLAVVDPAAVAGVTDQLDNYTLEDAQYVYDFLSSKRDDYIALSSAERYELTLKIAENLAPSWSVWYALENNLQSEDIRESFNIGNVNWIVQHMLGGGKAIIWAHNGHVGNRYLPDQASQSQMLGSRLKEQYGDEYYVIATEFYGGRFLAWDACGGTVTTFTEHTAAQPHADTYAYQFQRANIPLFYLNLRDVDYTLPETAWIQGPLKARFIGATYCAAEDSWYYEVESLPADYDGIVYFETTHPTTQITFDGPVSGSGDRGVDRQSVIANRQSPIYNRQ